MRQSEDVPEGSPAEGPLEPGGAPRDCRTIADDIGLFAGICQALRLIRQSSPRPT